MREVKRYSVRGQFDQGLDLTTTRAVVLAEDYAALEAENARLVERTGYLVEFVQQMARQQGEPYYQKLAKAALKKWSGL